RLVGLEPVQRGAVLVREHRDGRRPQFVRGPERPDRDLTPVGDEYLAEHAVGPPTVAGARCGPARRPPVFQPGRIRWWASHDCGPGAHARWRGWSPVERGNRVRDDATRGGTDDRHR